MFPESEIREAQEALDWHPADSPFWDQSGREHLEVIIALNLKPRTTETGRFKNYHRAFHGAGAV